MSNKKHTYKYVKQLHEMGCSLAAMAMITGLDYDYIDKRFGINFDKKGVDNNIVRRFICEQGFDCVQKVNQGCSDIKINNKRMLNPFADIHYISAQQFIDSKENHAIVMTKSGKIWDPDDPNHTTILDRFYEIQIVLGFWKS